MLNFKKLFQFKTVEISDNSPKKETLESLNAQILAIYAELGTIKRKHDVVFTDNYQLTKEELRDQLKMLNKRKVRFEQFKKNDKEKLIDTFPEGSTDYDVKCEIADLEHEMKRLDIIDFENATPTQLLFRLHNLRKDKINFDKKPICIASQKEIFMFRELSTFAYETTNGNTEFIEYPHTVIVPNKNTEICCNLMVNGENMYTICHNGDRSKREFYFYGTNQYYDDLIQRGYLESHHSKLQDLKNKLRNVFDSYDTPELRDAFNNKIKNVEYFNTNLTFQQAVDLAKLFEIKDLAQRKIIGTKNKEYYLQLNDKLDQTVTFADELTDEEVVASKLAILNAQIADMSRYDSIIAHAAHITSSEIKERGEKPKRADFNAINGNEIKYDLKYISDEMFDDLFKKIYGTVVDNETYESVLDANQAKEDQESTKSEANIVEQSIENLTTTKSDSVPLSTENIKNFNTDNIDLFSKDLTYNSFSKNSLKELLLDAKYLVEYKKDLTQDERFALQAKIEKLTKQIQAIDKNIDRLDPEIAQYKKDTLNNFVESISNLSLDEMKTISNKVYDKSDPILRDSLFKPSETNKSNRTKSDVIEKSTSSPINELNSELKVQIETLSTLEIQYQSLVKMPNMSPSILEELKNNILRCSNKINNIKHLIAELSSGKLPETTNNETTNNNNQLLFKIKSGLNKLTSTNVLANIGKLTVAAGALYTVNSISISSNQEKILETPKPAATPVQVHPIKINNFELSTKTEDVKTIVLDYSEKELRAVAKQTSKTGKPNIDTMFKILNDKVDSDFKKKIDTALKTGTKLTDIIKVTKEGDSFKITVQLKK